MKFIMGSRNPDKIRAAREVLEKFRIEFYDFKAVEVDSGVSRQPLTLEDTAKGARNRALNAFEDGSYSIGIESGLIKMPSAETCYLNATVCAIYNGERYFIGLGSGFEMPEYLARLVVEENLDVDEAAFKSGLTDDKRGGYSGGLIEILSNGNLNRQDHHIRPAVEMAFTSLYHKLFGHCSNS